MPVGRVCVTGSRHSKQPDCVVRFHAVWTASKKDLSTGLVFSPWLLGSPLSLSLVAA
jgi:hypothetical protein